MRRLLPIPVLLVLSGCGTISDLGNLGDTEELLGSPGPHIYGGVRFDCLKSREEGPRLFNDIYIFDLIFSFPLDTALLPFTVLWDIFGPDPPRK
jgi:uncharacterized protein YceK